MRRAICSVVVSVLLTGCFGPSEPTSAEVNQAIKEYCLKLQKTNFGIELVKTEKISCVAADGKPGFSCDVNITFLRWNPYTFGDIQKFERNRVYNVRFIKTPNGWEAPQVL